MIAPARRTPCPRGSAIATATRAARAGQNAEETNGSVPPSGKIAVITATVATIYAGKSFHLEMDGRNVTGSISVPNTQGWDCWTTVTVTGVGINAGTQALRFVADSDSFNVSSFDIETAVDDPPPW